MVPDCRNCTEKCPQAERAHEIALGRMYATKELFALINKLESGQLVEVVRCRECIHYRETMDWDKRKYMACHRKANVIVEEKTPDDFCSCGERK